MPGAPTAFERAHIVRETEQLQTTLVGMLAAIQDGTQQAVDRLSQHTPLPRTSLYLAHSIAGLIELLQS